MSESEPTAQVVERSEIAPGVALLRLNRPSKLNAMTTELVQSLHDHLDAIAIDPAVRVVVLTGSGRGFCAGLDLGGYGAAPNSAHVWPRAARTCPTVSTVRRRSPRS